MQRLNLLSRLLGQRVIIKHLYKSFAITARAGQMDVSLLFGDRRPDVLLEYMNIDCLE